MLPHTAKVSPGQGENASLAHAGVCIPYSNLGIFQAAYCRWTTLIGNDHYFSLLTSCQESSRGVNLVLSVSQLHQELIEM